MQLLRKIVNNVDNSNRFIITPFRDVAYNLKNMLKNKKTLFKLLNFSNEKQRSNWLDNNIGTVYTFQGREAETVNLQ